MKKILFGFLAMLVSVTLFAERVSPDDAALVANNFMNVASAPGVKKAVSQKKMVRKATAEENLFYVYENESGEGWVIVAANDVVTPILAYSETGHFRTDNLPVNVKSWMGKYNHFITKIEADGVEASEEAAEEWNALRKHLRKAKGDAVVGPLVKTTWDQDSPYWNLCPGTGNNKAYTGCVATAMAQVMKYWEWPKKGTGSHTYQPMDPNNERQKSKRYGEQTANFGETTYDWANMKNSYSGTYTTTEATAVATLMFHCGVATEMMYGNSSDGGSGTYTVNYGDWTDYQCAQSAFPAFFGYKKEGLTGYMRDGYTYQGTTYYKKWSDADWTAMLKAELDKKHPIMYGGAGDEGGHSFICDGYDDAGYFHFNWGWSGENDGYYLLSSLKPGSGGAGGGSYDFSEDQDVIIGIVPESVDPVAVTGVSVTPTSATLKINGKVQLKATVVPSDADDKSVTWTSSNKAVATVSDNGHVVGISAGTAVITVTTTDGSFTAQAEITVTNEEETVFGCDEYSYTFTAQMSSSAQLGDLYWTLTMENGNSTNYDSYYDRGAQFGSKNNPAKKVSLQTNEVDGCLIGEVTVNAAMGNSGDGKLAVYIADQQIGATKSLTSSAKEYTFENTNKLQGSLEIRLTNTQKALYVKSIHFTPGEPDPSTAVENTAVEHKAVKVVKDGQVVIIRDGEMYNLLGVKL